MTTDPWFRPKRYGYGATPANWKGWAATFGFVGLTILLTAGLLIVPAAMAGSKPALWQYVVWGVTMALLTLGFVRFSKARTDGEWRWRTGKDGD